MQTASSLGYDKTENRESQATEKGKDWQWMIDTWNPLQSPKQASYSIYLWFVVHEVIIYVWLQSMHTHLGAFVINYVLPFASYDLCMFALISCGPQDMTVWLLRASLCSVRHACTFPVQN